MAFGIQVGLAGISTEEARRLGMTVSSKTIDALDRDGYMSSYGNERVKLIAETRKGLLVGDS